MTLHANEIPPGYVEIHEGNADLVVLRTMARPVREALLSGSLYEYATHHPNARRYEGRGAVYGVPLPSGDTRVVIRRSRHGGLFRGITGERFLATTRAPRELAAAVRLRKEGIPTPEVVAYATYRAGGPFRRADVATREVASASDLGAVLTKARDAAGKQALLQTVVSLLVQLTYAGARHPDLNVQNILIVTGENDVLEAWLLDVDRVWFDVPGRRRVAEANVRRLTRSLHKWRKTYAIPVDERDIGWLVSRVHDALVQR
ncbi:MAG: hypothetical protein H7Z74_05795 [Anaerolineae bacterium]|nr:hypothetical protein [Gemmatimonadaceae bacterium]